MASEQRLPHKSERYAPVLVLLGAFALRLTALGTRPIWYDDAFSLLLAQRDLGGVAAGTAADTMPPLYYVLLKVWQSWVGITPFALRMLSVAFSMLAVALAVVIASRLWTRRAGIWAGFLTALAPFQVYHAQELRMYGLLAFACLIYFYGVLRLHGLRRESQHHVQEAVRAFFLIAAGTVAALYTHNLAVVTLLAANLYFIASREWKPLLGLCAGQAAGAALFLPWVWMVPGQIEKIQRAFWTMPPSGVDVLQLALIWTTYLPLAGPLLGIALFVTLAVVVIAGIETFKRRFPGRGLVLSFTLVPPALLFALSYLMRPVWVPRGVIASSLGYWILLGGLCAAARPRVQAALAIGALALAACLLPNLYSGAGEWRRAPYEEADQFLSARAEPGDLILHDNKLSFFPMHVYDPALEQSFLPDPPGSGNDTLAPATQAALSLFPVERESALNGAARVWFVILQTALDEAAQSGSVQGNMERLDRGWQREQVYTFGDVRIVLYDTLTTAAH